MAASTRAIPTHASHGFPANQSMAPLLSVSYLYDDGGGSWFPR